MIDSATDQGQSWGPGLAIIFPDKTIRLNLRAPEGRFGIDTGPQKFAGYASPDAEHRLLLRIEKDTIVCEAQTVNMAWQNLATFNRKDFPGDPVSVRIGKTGPNSRPVHVEDDLLWWSAFVKRVHPHTGQIHQESKILWLSEDLCFNSNLSQSGFGQRLC